MPTLAPDPGRRRRRPRAPPYADPAFVFPEMPHTQYVPATWVPEFPDYLSLSFWTATAFSPTDVSAIKHRAKLLMMTEALVSLGSARSSSPGRSTSCCRSPGTDVRSCRLLLDQPGLGQRVCALGRRAARSVSPILGDASDPPGWRILNLIEKRVR